MINLQIILFKNNFFINYEHYNFFSNRKLKTPQALTFIKQ